MKRLTLYSGFILSAIAASFFTSDFDIQIIHRILSSNSDSVDDLSTPSSAQSKVRRTSKDTDKGASLNQSMKKLKVSSESKRKVLAAENENGSRGTKLGALSGGESEPNGLQEVSRTSSKLKKSASSKAEGSITDVEINSSKKTRMESKITPSRQQSENPEDEVLQSSMDPIDEGNIARKNRSILSSNKRQTTEVTNGEIQIHSGSSEGTENLSRDTIIASPDNENSKGRLDLEIKNDKESKFGDTQEFRRDSRAMSHDVKDSSKDQLPKNDSKESLSRESDGPTEKMTSVANKDGDMKNSKEFRRGGRAMSQEVSLEQNVVDQVSLDEVGSLKMDTTKKNSNSLTDISSTNLKEVGESSENSVSDESDQPRSEIKPRMQSKGSKTEMEPNDENPDSPNDKEGEKDASKSEVKSPDGVDDEGKESDPGSFGLEDSSNVQPRKTKVEQGVKGLRGSSEGATNVLSKAKQKSVKSE